MLHRILTLPLLAGSLLATSALASAQSPAPAGAPQTAPAPGQGAWHGKRMNRMRTALENVGLSDDQKTKIAGFMSAFRQSRQTATPETRKELLGQIEGVLTPAQRTQFETSLKPHTEPAASS